MEPETPEAPAEGGRKRMRLVARYGPLWLGVGAVALGASVWAARAPLVEALLKQNLAVAGIGSAFEIARVDLGGIELRGVRLGADEKPDLTIERLRADFAWAPFPGISHIRLDAPMLRATLDAGGFSLGSLDTLLEGGGGGGGLPDFALEIVDGRGLVATPAGPLPLTIETQGHLRRDFVGELRLPATSVVQGGNVFRGEGLIAARTDADALRADLTLAVEEVRLASIAAQALRVTAQARTDLDLRGVVDARVIAQSIATPMGVLAEADGGVRLVSGDAGPWRGEARVAGKASDGARAHWRARQAALVANFELADELEATGTVSADSFALTPAGRREFARAWPSLGAFPFGPLLEASRDAALDTLSDARMTAPFSLSDGKVHIGASEIAGASGGSLRLTPATAEAVVISLADGAVAGSGSLQTSGGGLPSARLDVSRARFQDGSLDAQATLAIEDYRARGAALRGAVEIALNSEGARVHGAPRMSGPLGGVLVEDLSGPLDLRFSWREGLHIAPAGGDCLDLRFARLRAPGLTFVNGALPICADEEGFYRTDARGNISGGFSMRDISWSGHMEGDQRQTARLVLQSVAARLSGASARFGLDALVSAPALEVQLAPDHLLRTSAPSLDAHLVAQGGAWSANGAVAAGVVDDRTLPAEITEVSGRWTAAPRGNDVVVRFSDGAARLTDRAPADAPADRRAAFNPVRVTGVSGALQNGRLEATGNASLEDGARRLARFEASHVLETGAGEAHVRSDGLVFNSRFQPFQITELARGVVENVRGPVEGEAHFRWEGDKLSATGNVRLDGLSLATSTLPVIENVSGEIRFDDLLGLVTPPSQRLTIGLLNPGIPVSNGVIDFQLLTAERVVIERAQWPFAGGVLAVAPAAIALGAQETRFSLTLAGVDVATFLAELKAPDLTATGTVGGTFPLVLKPEGAFVENGTLSTEGEGTISYAGRAGESMNGPARMAFDALRSFDYDALTLTLNGDLGGDLLTEINFRGASAIGVGIPGLAEGPLRANVAGVPFVFNVTVRAPFRQLGELAGGAFDPKRALEQARDAPPGDDQAPATGEIDPDAGEGR